MPDKCTSPLCQNFDHYPVGCAGCGRMERREPTTATPLQVKTWEITDAEAPELLDFLFDKLGRSAAFTSAIEEWFTKKEKN
jgi:hypothetical protein